MTVVHERERVAEQSKELPQWRAEGMEPFQDAGSVWQAVPAWLRAARMNPPVRAKSQTEASVAPAALRVLTWAECGRMSSSAGK